MPENILVTTTGLGRYLTSADLGSTSQETDLVGVFKIGDFGAARQTTSRPPYSEYIATRWYRAPEVLLFSRTYNASVDMWALGAVMAEVVNLQPLFPGTDQVDQVSKICAVLGSPSSDSVFDDRGFLVGGGPWPAGISLGQSVGFQFPQVTARPFYTHFGPSVNALLVECIRGLLLYDPQIRLSSRDCLDHPYFEETEVMRQPLIQPVINQNQ
ncbi:hypothetical protein NLJ89_g7874 [Agrocybe chaxingu]|uniref:Protein kinase domain-containing protein n=1 Tax=Agrocybe chaxingu TaxID=84603 RepID=A0A9W8JVH9_9AGAR|nr:hypothetical protein NLJ89_g7874 [Agrocybe chaxingu]